MDTGIVIAAQPQISNIGYPVDVRKTTLEFDEDKREKVAAILGTSGLKATVEAAFDLVIANHAFHEMVEAVRNGAFDLTNEEIEAAWD